MIQIKLAEIVRKTGAKSDSKVRQMQVSIRNGGRLPPIRVALIDETLGNKLHRLGLSTDGKKYFLLEGHHRFRATELEKRKIISATIVRKQY